MLHCAYVIFTHRIHTVMSVNGSHIYNSDSYYFTSYSIQHTFIIYIGWAEHNPDECWAAASKCLINVKNTLPPDCQIQALGITNHRESVVVWNKHTGKALHNTILWLDTRTQGKRQKMITQLGDAGKEMIRHKCGLPIETYFTALKLSWLYDNVPSVKDAMDNGTAMVGTIDCWLVYMLTKGEAYVTDVTNASRTMLMNIDTCQWDPELIKAFGLPLTMLLPRISSSSEVYGHVRSIPSLSNVPVSGILGDQQAALVGQGCLATGSVKNTYGTGMCGIHRYRHTLYVGSYPYMKRYHY